MGPGQYRDIHDDCRRDPRSTYTTEIMLASAEANDGHPHINHNVNRHDDLCHFLKHIVLTIYLNRMPATFS
jgi:hypothetical protein